MEGNAKLDPHARYMETHEWTRPDPDFPGQDRFVVGISSHAESVLGDVVFVELPKPGDQLNAGEVFGVIESVKSASDLYMPISGTIIAINNRLATEPSLVNKACYTDGWMLKIKAGNAADFDTLIPPEEYATIV